MGNSNSKRILVAPLDWGLGHTTRCIPIIRCLKELGHTVIVACNAWQRSFIENVYSDIEIVVLEGYNVTYSANEKLGKISLLGSIPNICSAIKREHNWLTANAELLNIDAIISDNRYGLHHATIPSVIITHQLEVQTGMGKGANRIVQKIHNQYLAKFAQIWVPDVAGPLNLGGLLSHPIHKPEGVVYIGLLSQFGHIMQQNAVGEYLLVLLSGPEPQRTILENKLWKQICTYEGEVVFVAGNDKARQEDVPKHVRYINRTGGAELAAIIQGAHTVICRSGYSTIMDLVLFGKRAVLIPTPGQTEQEYLAKYLNEKGFFTSASQKDIDVQQAVMAGDLTDSKIIDLRKHYNDHKAVIADWIERL